MSRVCVICGRSPVAGRTIARRGMAKKKGGVGKKITGTAKRRFLPNLRTIKTIIDGQRKRVRICARCLKSGKVIKIV